MQESYLRDCLNRGLSLEEIGRSVDRHPSTVSYWLEKYGLRAAASERHRARGGLRIEQLDQLVRRHLTVAEIAREVDRSVPTVRYWLTFHGLETTRSARRKVTARRSAREERTAELWCRRHGTTRHVRRASGRYRCGRCNSEAVTRRRQVLKRQMVDEAGGRCVICGYCRCVAALQFHHLDPAQKRFALSLKGLARSVDVVREEARKCVLLCANCHAEVEAGITQLPPPQQRDRG